LLYSILAYHEESAITSMSAEEDAALMTELLRYHNGLVDQGRMGPAARLGFTEGAVTLRGPGVGDVIDGPFAETKEALLACTSSIAPAGTTLSRSPAACAAPNPTAVYEIRPVMLYIPGAPLSDPGA
jgi:hypothetical protein